MLMTTGQQGKSLPSGTPEFPDLPWTELTTIDDVEAWIDLYNRELLGCVSKKTATGHGVCFTLTHGGQIFLHTSEESILLDVTPDAEWVAPVITAASGIAAPSAQIWVLPNDILTQLILGLNSVIATTRIVSHHNFKAKKRPSAG